MFFITCNDLQFFLAFLCIFNCLLLYKISHTVENYKRRNSNRSLLQYLMQLVAFYSTFIALIMFYKGKYPTILKCQQKRFLTTKIYITMFLTPLKLKLWNHCWCMKKKFRYSPNIYIFRLIQSHNIKVKIFFTIKYIVLNNYNTKRVVR